MSHSRHACRAALLATAVFGAAALAAPAFTPSPQGTRMNSVAPSRSAAAVHVMQQLVAFLTTVKSTEELTSENIGRQFGVSLTPEEEQSVYRSPDLGGGWNYGVGVSPSNKSMKRGFNFWLYNPQSGADPTPVCVLSLDALRKQLVAHGFVEKVTPSEIGGVDWVDFVKNDIVLTVTRRDLLLAPNGDECFSGLQTTDGR